VSTMSGTLVLNASYEVLTFVSWQRAVTLVMTGKAELHEADEDRVVRSQQVTVPYPRIIRLVKYVYVRFTDLSASLRDKPTKRQILVRDSHTCAYCGKHATTVDHVFPKSRGGQDTWLNLVAACQPCNNRKDDRTPEEAGMRLRWQPYKPDHVSVEQKRVWSTL
jgi:5-methylcytosine-specific restriction endonuclease McrA